METSVCLGVSPHSVCVCSRFGSMILSVINALEIHGSVKSNFSTEPCD